MSLRTGVFAVRAGLPALHRPLPLGPRRRPRRRRMGTTTPFSRSSGLCGRASSPGMLRGSRGLVRQRYGLVQGTDLDHRPERLLPHDTHAGCGPLRGVITPGTTKATAPSNTSMPVVIQSPPRSFGAPLCALPCSSPSPRQLPSHSYSTPSLLNPVQSAHRQPRGMCDSEISEPVRNTLPYLPPPYRL